MKTAMELALQRIKLLYDINDNDTHFEMFKEHYLELEKEQIIDAFLCGSGYNCNEEIIIANEFYNETYKNENL